MAHRTFLLALLDAALGVLVGLALGSCLAPGRRARRSAGILLLASLASCGREPTLYIRSVPDPSLSAPFHESAQIGFESSKPALVERHHALLLTRFEGVSSQNCPSELVQEAQKWAFALPRETRRDQANWLVSRFPRGWSPERTWVAGPLNGDLHMTYFESGPFTYCIGRVGRTLGWSSTVDPTKRHELEHELSLREYQTSPRFDAAPLDGDLVLVHDGATGLHEIVLRPRAGELVVLRRRSLSRPRGERPTLLAVGADLLLLWTELTPRSSRHFAGGCALMAMRRESGSPEWSDPVALTIDLGGAYACSARGAEILVAWLDDRFARVWGLALVGTGKLFAITSPDGGCSWETAACLQDPETERGDAGGYLFVHPSGESWLITTVNPDGWSGAPDGGDTLAVARGLERWAFLPGKHWRSLEALGRERILRGH